MFVMREHKQNLFDFLRNVWTDPQFLNSIRLRRRRRRRRRPVQEIG